jgi:CheY-like chemotaxis protein
MAPNLLKGKQTLAADGERDGLDILKEELDEFGVEFDSASACEKALRRLASLTYDLVILDITGVRGFDLLEYARAKQIPVAMLTAHAVSPQSLKKSVELGARAYLPKDQLRQIAPFLEDVLIPNYQSAWEAPSESFSAPIGENRKRFLGGIRVGSLDQ